MTYQVLARRLRPQRFADVVGQDHVTRTLQAAIAAGRVAHAFLFTGPRGVGKTTTARLLAKALNCERGLTPEPCNACSNCREIGDGTAFDVLEIDGASHTQVDKMRDLMETVAHLPLKSRFKIFIIDEVHMLSSHSFNALLKTLEEPPPHVKFIFATTEPHKVLATVVSRCQRYDLRRIGLGELRAHLRRTVDAERLALSDEALALVAREAEGSLRDAQSLLEQVLTVAGSAADDAAVRQVLGAADRRLVVAVADAVLAGDPGACVRHLVELHAHGYDAQRFFRLLLEADEALAAPARSVDPKLVLEMCVVRLATLPPLLPLDDILHRLEAFGAGNPAVPGGGAVRESVPPPRETTSGGGLWDRFLARVQEEKLVAPYMMLVSGTLLAADGEALRIGIDNEAARRELSRKETLQRLRAIASEVAGRELRVEVGPLPSERAGQAPLAQARRRTEETLADPMVQAAVEIFGAEVRGVRDRRR